VLVGRQGGVGAQRLKFCYLDGQRMGSLIGILIITAVAIALGLLLAYLPMRLLLSQMAKKVTAFIQRQRDRRASSRRSPDRRKSEESV
jgi:uncharacterized membrane protein